MKRATPGHFSWLQSWPGGRVGGRRTGPGTNRNHRRDCETHGVGRRCQRAEVSAQTADDHRLLFVSRDGAWQSCGRGSSTARSPVQRPPPWKALTSGERASHSSGTARRAPPGGARGPTDGGHHAATVGQPFATGSVVGWRLSHPPASPSSPILGDGRKAIAHSVPPSSSDNEKSTARTVSQPPPRPTHTPRRPRLDGTAAAPYARVVADRENDGDASERRTRQPPGGAADAGGRDRRREPLQPRLFHGRAPPQLAPESAAAASPRGRGCHRTPVSVAGAGAPLRSARRRGHRPPPPCPPFDNKSAAAAATAAAPAQPLQGAPRVRSAGPARGRRVAAVMPPVAAGRPRWKRTRNRGRKQKRREEKTHAMVSKNEGGKKHGGGQRVEAQMGGEGENTQGEHLVE